MENLSSVLIKTTNINLRISPILKAELIERGAKMGVNLSDYISLIITKEIGGINDPLKSQEYSELLKRFNRLKNDIALYEEAIEPLKESVGKDVLINGKMRRFQHPSDIIKYLVNIFNVKP